MQNNFSNKNIILFLSSQIVSLFGSSIVQFAIIWYITLKTSSGYMIAIGVLAGFLPQIIIAFFSGALIDKYNKKHIIIITDIVIAFVTLIQAIIFMLGYDSIWQLFIILAVRAAATGVQMPAVNSFIPEIVKKENLLRINGINSTISAAMMVISPALSGGIMAIMPIAAILMVDVVTCIIGVSIMFKVKYKFDDIKADVKNNYITELKVGIKYLKNNKLIKRLMIYHFLILFLATPAVFLTPLLVVRTFGEDVWLLSASEMVCSLGAVSGGLLVSTFGSFKDNTKSIITAGLSYGILMIAMGYSNFLMIYLIINFSIGVTFAYYNSPMNVIIQKYVEQEMLGRVFSFLQIATSSAFLLGMPIFGTLADKIDVQITLIASGICIILTVCYIVIFKWFKTDAEVNAQPQP